MGRISVTIGMFSCCSQVRGGSEQEQEEEVSDSAADASQERARCNQLYQQAHQARSGEYSSLLEHCTRAAAAHQEQRAVGLVFEQRATQVKEAASGDVSRDFDSWRQVDLRAYALIDQDENGFVSPDEFCKYLANTFELSEEECQSAFNKFDLNLDQRLGPDEFLHFSSQYQAERHLCEQKLKCAALERVVDERLAVASGSGSCVCTSAAQVTSEQLEEPVAAAMREAELAAPAAAKPAIKRFFTKIHAE